MSKKRGELGTIFEVLLQIFQVLFVLCSGLVVSSCVGREEWLYGKNRGRGDGARESSFRIFGRNGERKVR